MSLYAPRMAKNEPPGLAFSAQHAGLTALAAVPSWVQRFHLQERI